MRRTCHLELGDVSDRPSVFLQKRVRINAADRHKSFIRSGLTILVFLQNKNNNQDEPRKYRIACPPRSILVG